MNKTALLVGANGLTESNLAERLISKGVNTYGLARHSNTGINTFIPVAADLMGTDRLKAAPKDVEPLRIFKTTWIRNETEADEWGTPLGLMVSFVAAAHQNNEH